MRSSLGLEGLLKDRVIDGQVMRELVPQALIERQDVLVPCLAKTFIRSSRGLRDHRDKRPGAPLADDYEQRHHRRSRSPRGWDGFAINARGLLYGEGTGRA